MRISLIAAMAENRVIGKGNSMPWRMPADLQHFKQITMAKPVIMGRKTFLSIGRPLPGRRNIVISRDSAFVATGIERAASPEAALALIAGTAEVMIIGGGEIYRHFMPLATDLYLTFIDAAIEGDTYFPEWPQTFQKVASEVCQKNGNNQYSCTFTHWQKNITDLK